MVSNFDYKIISLYFRLSIMTEFEAAFSYFDCKGQGYISRDEMACMMRMLGEAPNEDALQAMLVEIDKYGTGRITFDLFLNAAAEKIRESETKEQLVTLFRSRSRGQDGFKAKYCGIGLRHR